MKNKMIIGVVAIVLLFLIFGGKVLLTLIGFGAGVVVGVLMSSKVKKFVASTAVS